MTTSTQPAKSNRSLFIALIVMGLTIVALILALVINSTEPAGNPGAAPTTPAAGPSGQGSDPADQATPSSSVPEDLGPVEPKTKELVESLWRRDENDPMALGKVDADVVVQVYYDFRCGYCAKAATETEPNLQRHIDDGTVRIEYHNLPILGDDSVRLAQGSVAAANQGKFAEYHRYVFAKQMAQQPVEASEDGIAAVAQEISVADLEKFRADYNAAETLAAVTQARTQGTNLGISGTPAFIIGYSYVPGFIPTETMDQLIDAEQSRPAS